jgi:hypothetical protein
MVETTRLDDWALPWKVCWSIMVNMGGCHEIEECRTCARARYIRFGHANGGSFCPDSWEGLRPKLEQVQTPRGSLQMLGDRR